MMVKPHEMVAILGASSWETEAASVLVGLR